MDGVSDDVLVFAGVIFSITVLVLWATRSRPQTVHLSLETWIQTVRTRVSGAPPEANAAADQNAPGPTGPNENQCPICFENWNTVSTLSTAVLPNSLGCRCILTVRIEFVLHCPPIAGTGSAVPQPTCSTTPSDPTVGWQWFAAGPCESTLHLANPPGIRSHARELYVLIDLCLYSG